MEGTTDPAQAFEDLRDEVSMLRRAVEALPGAWEENRPPDYSPDLGRIAKGLAGVVGQLDGIEKHPALRLTPEQHSQAVAQAGNMLMREASKKLDRAAQDAERERARLAGLFGTVRTQDRQFRMLCWTGGIALTVGLILSPIAAGVLPFGLNMRVAALVMQTDRWAAGAALMQAGNPESWRGVIDAANLVKVNRDALTACREAAGRSKTEQRCTITVPVQ
jgi:hypothetical protein